MEQADRSFKNFFAGTFQNTDGINEMVRNGHSAKSETPDDYNPRKKAFRGDIYGQIFKRTNEEI